MKEFTSIQFFNYPWDYVSAANWRKYPNEVSTHVVGVDVLRREVNPLNGKLLTERLITCKQPIPSWLQYLVGCQDKSYVREVSIIDPKEKTLVMRSVNLTMTSLLKVRETVIYKPDVNDPINKTQFKQIAQIESSYGWQSMRSKIEQWAVERFGQNASKGKLGFESVLKLGWIDVTEVIDQIADKLVFEVNHITNQIINEINGETNEILSDLSISTSEILNDIKKCTVFKDVNSTTFGILKEMNDKTNVILSDLNDKTHNVIQEINEKTSDWLSNLDQRESEAKKIVLKISDKTNQLVSEMNDMQNEVLKEMNLKKTSVFRALDERALELFNDQPSGDNINNNNNNNTHDEEESTFLNKIKFKLTHIFKN